MTVMPDSNSEGQRIGDHMSALGIDAGRQAVMWGLVDRVLNHGPASLTGSVGQTGLVLGYVQSGKTTAITALAARAADRGYRVVVAILGSTNLLLSQNTARLLDALGIGSRRDYVWAHLENPRGRVAKRELATAIDRGRVVLITVLKHAGRIDHLADVVGGVVPGEMPCLVIDDEADQASLNTAVRQGDESRTYEAISRLRNCMPRHLYVQFTATPYAPLLLSPADGLRPSFIEFLEPGAGYTGGREFFVDHADQVVHPIPDLDEQRPRALPVQLPASLVKAFGFFVAGAALLTSNRTCAPPISMLVHAASRTDVQERYDFLIRRLIRDWQDVVVDGSDSLPAAIADAHDRLVNDGARPLPPAEANATIGTVLSETTVWLVNSASALDRVDWRVSPFHVLVGGNKLDRGFTVEGLTVTYMNRPASEQIDTIEQRARAFGYRGELLPYCGFFATPRTVRLLRGIVDTEYDLRSRLRDHLAAGGSVTTWSEEVGLLLPPGTVPARQSVLEALINWGERPAWHQLRRPSLLEPHLVANEQVLDASGLVDAPLRDFGRLHHRTLEMSAGQVVDDLLRPWAGAELGSSPGWRHEELLDYLERLAPDAQPIPVILLEHVSGDGQPRVRDWHSDTGFVNLMQGPDPGIRGPDSYPGDRAIGGVAQDPEAVVVQVHRVVPRRADSALASRGVLTLAVHLGPHQVTRRGVWHVA